MPKMNLFLSVIGISVCIAGILAADYDYDYGQQKGSSVKSCPTTLEFNPVCGSDGRTYSNPSALACAARENPGLKQDYTGRCSSSGTTTTTSRYQPTTDRWATTSRTTSRWPLTTDRTTSRWPITTYRTTSRWPITSDRTTARWPLTTEEWTTSRWPSTTDDWTTSRYRTTPRRTTARWPTTTDLTTSRWQTTDSPYNWPSTTRRGAVLPTRTPTFGGGYLSNGDDNSGSDYSGGNSVEVVDLNTGDSGYGGSSKGGSSGSRISTAGGAKGGYNRKYRHVRYHVEQEQ